MTNTVALAACIIAILANIYALVMLRRADRARRDVEDLREARLRLDDAYIRAVGVKLPPVPEPLNENGCWRRDTSLGAPQWEWVQFGGSK